MLERPEGHLYSICGIWHADHLRRVGQPDYARRVTEANLEICERNRWTFMVSMCHRVLGDLDGDQDQHESAGAHYDQALKMARGITLRDVLIEALLARGRWATPWMAAIAATRRMFASGWPGRTWRRGSPRRRGPRPFDRLRTRRSGRSR